MIANKTLIAAAVLSFAVPAVPAVAHDYGDYGYRWGYRCLACPGRWDGHDGWRGYGWHRYGWRPYSYNGGYDGGWRPHYRPYYRPYYRSWDNDRWGS
jgi:hypothetical protein